MRNPSIVAAGLFLAGSSLGALAQEDLGRMLHQQHCTSCHGTEVYTRADRFVDSREALQERVAFCARNAAKVNWKQNQVDAVTLYLNDSFYDF